MGLLLNKNKSGIFETSGTIDGFSSAPWRSIVAANLNDDVFADLAATTSTGVAVCSAIGTATLPIPLDYPTGGTPTSVAAADFGGDDKNDLVVASSSTKNVSVLINKGDGSFGQKKDYDAGTTPSSVAAKDLNGDNKPDIVVANSGSNNVSVLINKGDGTFPTKVDYPVGVAPHSVAAVDLNGDPDPSSVAIEDVNGDNKRDVVVANQDGDNVMVLLNQGTASC